MSDSQETIGFPRGDLLFRSWDENLKHLILGAGASIFNPDNTGLPPVTAESHFVDMSIPTDIPEPGDSGKLLRMKLRFPLPRAAFNEFDKPPGIPTKQEILEQHNARLIQTTRVEQPSGADATPTAVDSIFAGPRLRDIEPETVEPSMERMTDYKARAIRYNHIYLARAAMLLGIADQLPEAVGLDDYLSSHGVPRPMPVAASALDSYSRGYVISMEGKKSYPILASTLDNDIIDKHRITTTKYLSPFNGRTYRPDPKDLSAAEWREWREQARMDIDMVSEIVRRSAAAIRSTIENSEPNDARDVIYYNSSDTAYIPQGVSMERNFAFHRGPVSFVEPGIHLLHATYSSEFREHSGRDTEVSLHFSHKNQPYDVPNVVEMWTRGDPNDQPTMSRPDFPPARVGSKREYDSGIRGLAANPLDMTARDELRRASTAERMTTILRDGGMSEDQIAAIKSGELRWGESWAPFGANEFKGILELIQAVNIEG